MPRYAYRAISSEGWLVKGELELPDLDELERHLGRAQLELIHVRQCLLPKLTLRQTCVPLRERIHFFFHLEHLLQAGIPLMDALQELKTSSGGRQLGSILTRMIDSIESGNSLSAALAEHPGTFCPVTQALIHAGERSGNLPKVLEEVGTMLKREDDFRTFLRKVSIYPGIVLVVAFCAVSVALMFVVPELAKLFKTAGAALPLQTRVLISLSSAVREHGGPLLLTGILATLTLPLLLATRPDLARRMDHLKLRLPLVGRIYLQIALARFSSLLAILYASGIPVLQALDLAGGVIANRHLGEALNHARADVARGTSLSDAFGESSAFPALIVRMFRLGEQTGALDTALLNAASFLDREVRESFARFQAWIEPALTLMLGCLMLWIASAILSPIYDIITRMKL